MTNSAGRKLSGICVIASTGTGDSSYAIGSITAAGQYSLTYLIPGRYQVIFLTGCGNNSNYAPQWWRHALTVTKATAVRVTAGATVTGINAALVRGAAISGVVRFRGKAGPPLAGICVTATGLGGMLGIQSQVSSLSTGRYRLTSLGTGKYRVQFAPGLAARTTGITWPPPTIGRSARRTARPPAISTPISSPGASSTASSLTRPAIRWTASACQSRAP